LVYPNRSLGGASFVSAYLVRQPRQEGPPPRLVEFSLALGGQAARPMAHAFEKWPHSAGHHRLMDHARALRILRRAGRGGALLVSATMIDVAACVQSTQLAFAATEAAVLLALLLAGRSRARRKKTMRWKEVRALACGRG
jgi:hypothetical protein